MNLPIYELDVGEGFASFEFISEGHKGEIYSISREEDNDYRLTY